MATGVPSYIRPYGISYSLSRKTKEDTTQIRIMFEFRRCRGLSTWGKDWNQAVKIDDSMDPHGLAAFHTEAIRWQEAGEGIVLMVTTGVGCSVQLEQKKQGALPIPYPSQSKTLGPGTELLEQVIDLVAAGDLRDYLTTARILHTDMSTYDRLSGHHLYDGGAIPERLIPGTNSRAFIYIANDTGWINRSIFFYVPPQPGPRTVQLRIPVDTVTNCISPESLEARMRQRRIRFRKRFDRILGPYLHTIQRGNAFSIGYYLEGSCIQEFNLKQETDFVHSPP